jgi:hypothetical protein
MPTITQPANPAPFGADADQTRACFRAACHGAATCGGEVYADRVLAEARRADRPTRAVLPRAA